MNNTYFSYRIEPIGIDFTDQKDIQKHNYPLQSFAELAERFKTMQLAYEGAGKERADLTVNAFPPVGDATELTVFHDIRRKLFSRAVKKNGFSLCLTKYCDDKLYLYFYETQDIAEVKQIFSDWIEGGKLPDLSRWKSQLIV